MMMTEAVFTQAAPLAGQLDHRQTQLLRTLCQTAAARLEAQLRDGLTAEDCREAFVTAAGLYALAAFQEAEQVGGIAEFRAGDLTVKHGSAVKTSLCLQQQAERMIRPFLKDSFAFLGV